MKYLLLITTFIFGCISCAIAQVKISGFVHSEDSLPVSGADILIHNITSENKPLIKFTRTNSTGYYAVIIENLQLDYSITAKAPAFRTVVKELRIPAQSSDIRQNFVLHSSVSYLDTVKVNIRMTISKSGDTITFNPDAFALKNETNIEDMLKRLPGMEVKENGEIFFNGRHISNVLIDGDDLFKENYQVLTQNAAPKIVERVQVIKNYQKDQLLKEFDRTGGQVINLKIKDQYKNYLFGNATIGYGSRENKVGDLFLIKLGAKIKTQTGVNYNTTGANYNSDNEFYLKNISRNNSPFFTYAPATELLSVPRYSYPQIPGYYQKRNKSIRAHFNTLFKKKEWETLINAGFSKDKVRENQELNSVYRDGTALFSNDAGTMTDSHPEFSITSSKNAKNESIYINAALQNTHRGYRGNTLSNQALESQQKLSGDNTDWQFNFNYNRKIGNGILWSNTLGYFNQNIDGQLITNPDFLFWLFPENLSTYKLLSQSGIQLRYLNFKSDLIINRRRWNHQFTGFFSSEKRTIASTLMAEKDEGITTPFENDNRLSFPNFTLKYKGAYRVSPQSKLILNLSNDPQTLNYSSAIKELRKTTFYYDYSIGYSAKNRNASIGLNAGIKKQPQNHNQYFPNAIQSDFHRLLSGRIDSFGTQSTYIQANYSLFSLNLGWIAFLSLNLNHNKNKYIRSIETKGIGTIHSYLYHPNSTNQLFLIFNSQKTLGEWPFSLNSNVIYNTQSYYNSFNGNIRTSSLMFLNATIGIKSLFESVINFDYHFLWLHSRNKTRSSEFPTISSNTVLNKVNIHLTPPHLFNTSITLNNMVTNEGNFQGTFLDIKLNKKLLKERLIIEFNLRNIFDKKYISNTIVGSLYTRENRIEIRGREFFFTLRYEFR